MGGAGRQQSRRRSETPNDDLVGYQPVLMRREQKPQLMRRAQKGDTCWHRLAFYWQATKQARIAASKTTGLAALIGGSVLFLSAGASALGIMLSVASPQVTLAVVAGLSLTAPWAAGLSFAVAAAVFALVCLVTYAGVHASKALGSKQRYRGQVMTTQSEEGVELSAWPSR